MGTIVDSQVTTIIAAVILYMLGTGSVRGFAMTLLIGIVLSVFTSVAVSLFSGEPTDTSGPTTEQTAIIT